MGERKKKEKKRVNRGVRVKVRGSEGQQHGTAPSLKTNTLTSHTSKYLKALKDDAEKIIIWHPRKQSVSRRLSTETHTPTSQSLNPNGLQ